ncbi:MAG TPA: hypothetical protein VJ650_06350 [Gemmatimonadaceae bacterium]|nr:hypothetical protein [Gemmatimonadaceae bacterium]
MGTRLTTLVLATAALAGCANPPRVQRMAPEAPPPLRVWVSFPIGSSDIYPIFTNREAYVALFEIVPGRGVTMVYPSLRGHTVASSAHYANLTVQPGRMFYHTDPFGFASRQPRSFYAVASVAPLNLERLQTSLGGIRRVLGRMYGSYRSYDVIDRLTAEIVPMQADDDWATDLFVDWPMLPTPRFSYFQIARCANGRIIYVPAGYPYHGCPGDPAPAVTITQDAKAPVKEVALEAPRAPRRGTDREAVELSTPDGGKRRAEPSDRPPQVGGAARSREGIRYSGDRRSGRSSEFGGAGERSTSNARAEKAERAERERAQRAEPASAPSRSERSGERSGGEKKP